MDIKGLGNATSTVSAFLAGIQDRKVEVQKVESPNRTDLVQVQSSDVRIGDGVPSLDEGSIKNFVQASLEDKSAVGVQATRQQALLNSAMAQSENAASNAERTLAGKRAARSVMQEMQQSAMEASRRNLDESRQNIRTASEEAAQGEGTVPGEAVPARIEPAAPETVGRSSSETASQQQSIDVEI